MKIWILIILFISVVGNVSAQRCGDEIWLYLHDSDNRVIPAASLTSVKVRWDDDQEIILTEKSLREVPSGVKSFAVPTWCGLRSPQIIVSYGGKEMVLNVYNAFGDLGNILLEAVPFRDGVYEIDLRGTERKNCDLDRSIEEPPEKRSGTPVCVVRAARWKRSTATASSKAELSLTLKAPKVAHVGDDISKAITITAKNSGAATAPRPGGYADLTIHATRGYQIDLVLSTDTKAPLAFADGYVTSFTEDMLVTGARHSYQIIDLTPGSSKEYRFETATIPEFVPAGNYFLCAVIDPGRTVDESDEGNNVSCAKIKIQDKLPK